MQFSLQTLLLSFVVVAASVSLCGPWGMLLAAVILACAGYIRMAENRGNVWARVILYGMLGSCFWGLFIAPGISRPRNPGRRSWCLNNQNQIARALLSYESDHGHFPPAYIADANGKPMHSWRVLILPYLERRDIYEAYDFNEPWNGPHNSKLAVKLSILSCPSHNTNPICTNYVAVVGPKTVWPGDKTCTALEVVQGDGESGTILLLELPDSNIHWMEPRDISFEELCEKMTPEKRMKLFDAHRGSSVVTFVDGHSETHTDRYWEKNVKALLTKTGGEKIDMENDPGPSYRAEFLPIAPFWTNIASLVILIATTLYIIHRPLPGREKSSKEQEVGMIHTEDAIEPEGQGGHSGTEDGEQRT